MKIRSENHDGVMAVTLEGRFDALSADAARDELQRLTNGPVCLLLNFAGVTYLSSAGLRVLFRVAKDLAAARGRLALCQLSPQVRQVIDLAGYSAVAPVCADVPEALAALRPVAP